jgi:tetratricopeptide (TPR) repeat protein
MRMNFPDQRPQTSAANNEALESARFALDTDRPADAERLAAGILKSNSGNREATKILGFAMIMLGRAAEAIAPLEKAARGGHDPELETQLAIALQRCGRTEDAVTWLKRAVRRKPPFAAAFYELGLALTALHRLDEAIEAFRRGVEAAPMMTDMVVNLGYAYERAGDRGNAAASFRRALAMNPAHRGAILALGTVLINDRDFAQAADLFRNALQLDPTNAEARISLGNCLLNLGQAEDGIAWMRAAAGSGPQFYGKALRTMVASSRGRFWLRPSAASKMLRDKTG